MKSAMAVLFAPLVLAACGGGPAPADDDMISAEEAEVVAQVESGMADSNQLAKFGYKHFPAGHSYFADTAVSNPNNTVLFLSNRPGGCGRFQQGKLSKNSEELGGEVGYAGNAPSQPDNAYAKPINPGYYEGIRHDAIATATGRWVWAGYLKRDASCQPVINEPVSAKNGGGYFFTKAAVKTGGEIKGVFILRFGAQGQYKFYGAFDAERCELDPLTLPEELGCE